MEYSGFFDQVYANDTVTGPHGWIQWKGTQVCVDLHCSCGHHNHVDAEFFYFYKCPGCGQTFAVGATIKLLPLTEEQLQFIQADRPDQIHTGVLDV